MIIATPGAADANCYLTLAEADAYFSNRAHASTWEALDDLNKEQLLITASSILDWYATWKGIRVTATQSMDWPRTGVLDKIGEEYLDTVIPPDVKTATCELALSTITSDRTADNALAGLKAIQAGSLGLKTDVSVSNSLPDTVPDKIWKILTGLTNRSGVGVVRLIRA